MDAAKELLVTIGVKSCRQSPPRGPWTARKDHDSLAEVEYLDVAPTFDAPPTPRAGR
jgi:hypothetical protein